MSRKTIFIIFGIIIILILGYFYLSMKSRLTDYRPQTQQPTPTQTQNSTSTSTRSDETAHWKTYSNSKYYISFKYPPALTVEEIDPVKSGEVSESIGKLLWINISHNFTVEILSKKPVLPYDDVYESYSQKQQVAFGKDKKSLTAYLNFFTIQDECYGVNTVRGSCKDYFAIPVQGQKYWYIFTGTLENKSISKDGLLFLSSAVVE